MAVGDEAVRRFIRFRVDLVNRNRDFEGKGRVQLLTAALGPLSERARYAKSRVSIDENTYLRCLDLKAE